MPSSEISGLLRVERIGDASGDENVQLDSSLSLFFLSFLSLLQNSEERLACEFTQSQRAHKKQGFFRLRGKDTDLVKMMPSKYLN